MAAANQISNFNPKPPDKSYASIVSGVNKLFSSISPCSSDSPIKIKQANTFKGEPAVFFSRSEIDYLAVPFKFTLVGKFPNCRPPLEAIHKLFAALNLKSEFHIGLMDPKHVLIRLDNEMDYNRIWLKECWIIFNYAMHILKWTPNFDFNSECPVVPVWINLPSLPIHLYDRKSLCAIASMVGKPMQVDASTATLLRPSVARVCVEVDVSKILPKRVWVGIENEDEGYWQAIQYEGIPKYCKNCAKFGHEERQCEKYSAQVDNGKNHGENINSKGFVQQKSNQEQHHEQQWVMVKNRRNNKGKKTQESTISNNIVPQDSIPQTNNETAMTILKRKDDKPSLSSGKDITDVIQIGKDTTIVIQEISETIITVPTTIRMIPSVILVTSFKTR